MILRYHKYNILKLQFESFFLNGYFRTLREVRLTMMSCVAGQKTMGVFFTNCNY